MSWRQTIAAGCVGLSILCASLARADTQLSAAPSHNQTSLFDPARHMRVAEVKPGMKGYGVSVFEGTTLEKFDVEVVSILKDFNPKYDVILIRCHGANLEHTGAIAGMSGSPIYLYDDSGKARMVGAFAYGWPLQKDPIAGVQPIEYMLDLPQGIAAPTTAPSDSNVQSLPMPGEQPAVRQARWSLDQVVLLPGMKTAPPNYPLGAWGKFIPNPRLLSGDGDATRMIPLATPLMTAGLPPRVMEEMEPVFRAYGLVPLQAGGGGAVDDVDPKIEPGSVLAIPLLGGDVDMSAVGTCTEVIGDKIVAFGHPFNNEGPISLPMGNGSIQGIIASYMTSFKLGSLAHVRGTLTNDQTVGVTGTLGKLPRTVPIDIRVKYADGSEDQTYHFVSAVHPKFTPLLAAAAITSAISGAKELPQYHTVDYDLTLQFTNGKSVHVVNTGVNVSAADLFFEIGTPLIAASDNPFERVMVQKIAGTMVVTPQAMEGQILYANVPRSRYRPGETVTAFVTYRPFRAGGEMVMPVTLELPRDLPDGTYQFTISDWQKFLDDERTAEPFKFTAETIDQVFDVLRDVAAVRHNAVYVRLLRQPDGVAIGHTAMPKLPSSRREIMIGAGRSDTTEFVSSALKVIPTSRVMNGSADFEITIDKNANTDLSSSSRPPHRDVHPSGKPATPEAPAAKPNAQPGQPGGPADNGPTQ
jgi:hypothetical protein